MTKLYSVKAWNKHYEKAQTRKVENAQWIPISVKHDGKGFRRLIAMPNGVAIYGAWILILQVAAKCKPTRGVLLDDDGPLTAEDLSLKTGAPDALIEEAFAVLSSDRIGWLVVSEWYLSGTRVVFSPMAEAKKIEVDPSPETVETKQVTEIVVSEWDPSAKSLQLQDITGQDITEQNRTGYYSNDLKIPFLLPLPISLNTPEFTASWESWLRYTVNRAPGGRASQDTLSRQLIKLATYGPARGAELLEEAMTQGWSGPVWPEQRRGSSREEKPALFRFGGDA